MGASAPMTGLWTSTVLGVAAAFLRPALNHFTKGTYLLP
jgi:hypothetical protein